MKLADRMHLVGRRSGYAAVGSVIICLIAGSMYTAQANRIDPPTTPAADPGQTLVVEDRDTAIWGAGDDLDPAQVHCEWAEDTGQIPIRTSSVDEPRPTATHDTLGRVTMLATIDSAFGTGDSVICEGGSLSGWAMGPAASSDARGNAIFAFSFAGFAAIWAVVALRITRPRRGD